MRAAALLSLCAFACGGPAPPPSARPPTGADSCKPVHGGTAFCEITRDVFACARLEHLETLARHDADAEGRANERMLAYYIERDYCRVIEKGARVQLIGSREQAARVQGLTNDGGSIRGWIPLNAVGGVLKEDQE